jgi:hypothetical protein
MHHYFLLQVERETHWPPNNVVNSTALDTSRPAKEAPDNANVKNPASLLILPANTSRCAAHANMQLTKADNHLTLNIQASRVIHHSSKQTMTAPIGAFRTPEYTPEPIAILLNSPARPHTYWQHPGYFVTAANGRATLIRQPVTSVFTRNDPS